MTRNSVQPIKLASIDSSTFTGTYQQLTNGGGIEQPVFYFKIVNNSNVDVTVSYDGTNDHDFVPKNTVTPINLQTNNLPNNHVALLQKFINVYVKGGAGAGKVYLSGWYSPQGV